GSEMPARPRWRLSQRYACRPARCSKGSSRRRSRRRFTRCRRQPSRPVPIPQSRIPPPPDVTRAEMVNWLSTNGYRDYQVAALMQLADTESGFRPCVIGPGGYHYLFQWGGVRLRQLREFARTSGCPQLKTQLAFA